MSQVLSSQVKSKTNQNGFGMIEVIMGMFLLSLVLMGMTGFTTSYLCSQKRHAQMAQGVTAGQDVMEYYRGILRDTAQIDSFRTIISKNGKVELPEQIRTYQNTVYKINAELNNIGVDGNTLRLTSNVKWSKNTAAQDSQVVALNTYIRRRL